MSDAFATTREFTLSGGGRLFVAPSPAKDTVSVYGSVLGGPNHLLRTEQELATLLAELLDAGTKTKTKEVLRGALADRGIELSFYSVGDRTGFAGRCFPEDLQFLLSTVAECLQNANIPAAELEAARARHIGLLTEAKNDTHALAVIALTREIYDPEHVNYALTLDEEIASTQKADRKGVIAFKSSLGRGGLILAVAGDVRPETAKTAAEKAFGKLPKGTEQAISKVPNKKRPKNKPVRIVLPDKATIDVISGTGLGFNKLDSRFPAAFVLGEMLGGGFVSHLVRTVREEAGLTYHISAGLRGFTGGADGFLQIQVTFAPELYEKGVALLNKELKNFLESGVSAKAFEAKKEELIGSYLVGLTTTSALAKTLHNNAADGRDLEYLRQYPAMIEALTLKDVRAIADSIKPESFSFAAAGTFPKR